MYNFLFSLNLIFMNCLLTQSCNQGEVDISGDCIPCSSNCIICTIPYTCDTCKTAYYVTPIKQCSSCSSNCEVCSGGSGLFCSSCFPKYYKATSSCNSCPTYCATCTSNSVCQTCVDHYLIIGTLCQVCDASCKTCQTTTTTCTSCDAGQYLSGSSCLPCTSPCSECVNASTSCTACIDSNRTAVNYQCVCADEYYTDGSNQCQPCAAPCSKCENNATNCTDCVTTFTLSTAIPYKCDCSFGYFQVDSQTCDVCVSPCETCEFNQSHCLTCLDPNSIVNSSYQCVCQLGWLLDADGVTCNQCQLPCLECVDTINKCVTCYDQTHQSPDTCVCEPGWIIDPNYNCISCQQPCKTCEISTSQCLTCLDINQEVNSSKQCVCKSTYYADSPITCAQCQQPCYECDTIGCINCIDVNQILDSNKQCICKSGYVQSGYVCLQCLNPCTTCINSVSQCLTCMDPNQIVQNFKCLCKEGFVKKGNYCCDEYCSDCQGVDSCNSCIKGYFLTNINRCLQCIDYCDICYNQSVCQTCQEGYFINQQSQCEACVPSCKVCGDPQICDVCFDGYYLLDWKCEACNQNCLTCNEVSDKCVTCRPNYEINSNNQCFCKFGYYEEQNQCYRCEYPCKTCLSQSICSECFQLSNLHLDENAQCKCSPGFFWKQNSCSQCHQTCLTCIDDQLNCLTCDQKLHRILKYHKCQCSQDYFESEDALCISCLTDQGKSQEICKYSDCNDKIWTYGEECDDGNDVIRDGCSNCKIDHNYSCSNEILKQSICFQCSTHCIKCQLDPQTKKSQCTKCEFGYFLDKNDCVECSINCLECIDQAYNCVSCKFPQQKNHKCELCESGYYADEDNGTCLNICGDQIKVKEEECDDGNTIKGDGCDNQCRLEGKYIFVNGVSIIPNYPKPLLQSVGSSQIYSVTRLFKLYYTSPIVIKEGFQIKDYLTFHISNNLGVQQIDQSIQLTQDTQQINEFNQSEFSLMMNITFSRSSQDENLIVKFLNKSVIYSNEGYSQIETEVSCLIPKVIFIDDAAIAQVQMATKSNTYMLYFIGAMCGGSVIFGGVEVFFNLLDTLQMLSYFKYINTQLPYNLQSYFELFGFAQFNFIQKIFDFSGFIDELLDTEHLKKIPSKVASDEITSLFIINSATIATVWLSLFGIYAIAKVIPKLLYSFKFKFYSESLAENSRLVQIGVYFLTIKFIINKLCFVIIQEFFYSGILRAHMATAYDFTFSVVLQLYALELNSPNYFIRLSSLLACVASSIYIFTIYFVIKISQMKKYALNNQEIQAKYGSIFDGIKKNQFSKYLNAILLIKKLIFMLLLIFAYEFPTFQTISIMLLSISTSLFYIFFNPIEDKLEYFKQLYSEVSISCTLLSITILTCDFELAYFTYEIRQYFGWCCIFSMTSILSIQLGIDGFQQWRFIFQKYKQVRKIAQLILGVFQNNRQVPATSNIFQ
ncbi:unnamed protein product [Paramecium octaurelia]|uniref:EGF-like domain-containing protein n=1 Tax=Paramecium octaurelia TaxID=43137 RepID=A0A8S1XVP3_PAROT|nr:unnamed protein product [Paramecium octaurelia]